MGACKTAVLLIGVAAVFHLVPFASSQPSQASTTITKDLDEEEEEEVKKSPKVISFEQLVLSTETARQRAALAAALVQEYINGASIVASRYEQFQKLAEDKNSTAEEYADWTTKLEAAASDLLAEEVERLKLAEKVDKHSRDYARLSRRSRKEAREGAMNATWLEAKARDSRSMAMELFSSAKLKHERAEDYIERAREEENIAMELQRKAMELSNLAEEHRTKASSIAAKAQKLEDSAYQDEVSAVKHEKEAKLQEREAEEARANDRESSLIAMEYLIRQMDKQCKAKRLRVTARNMHVLAEVYDSEASTLRGITKREEKDKDFYKDKAEHAAKQKVLYKKTIKGLLSLFRKHMQVFKQRLKKTNKVAAKNGYEYVIMNSPSFTDDNLDIERV